MIPASALLALASLPAAAAQDAPLVLHADRVVTGEGRDIAGGRVLIRDGRVIAVGEEVPEAAGARRHRVHGVLAPGFVDAFTDAGRGPAREDSLQLSPGLRATDSLDPDSRVLEGLLAAGVTAVHLVPDPVNVLAGRSGVVLSGGADAVLSRDARLVASLVGGLIEDPVLGPTSLAGGLEILQVALQEGVAGLEEGGALVFVDSAEGVRGALSAGAHFRFEPTFVALGDLGAYGGELQGRLFGLPVMPAGAWSLRLAETWRRLHAAGARFAFGTWSYPGRPGALRQSAMALARATGDADAALASITSHPADLAGASRLGRIAPGARADLVLWSGHPLDASSSVKAVMIAGSTVWTAPAPENP